MRYKTEEYSFGDIAPSAEQIDEKVAKFDSNYHWKMTGIVQVGIDPYHTFNVYYTGERKTMDELILEDEVSA